MEYSYHIWTGAPTQPARRRCSGAFIVNFEHVIAGRVIVT